MGKEIQRHRGVSAFLFSDHDLVRYLFWDCGLISDAQGLASAVEFDTMLGHPDLMGASDAGPAAVSEKFVNAACESIGAT